MAVINKNGTYMALPSAIKRGGATALDTTSVWYDRALMEFYAQGGGKLGEVDVPITAYVGQILTLVDEANDTATAYLIVDEAGHLNEVGSATLGDNASIELVDGVLSVKDFGKKYYKYIAAVEGGEAAHYELTEGWVAGLEPRVVEVDGTMVIGWYEPNPTTAEGVKDQVVEVQGEVEQVKDDVKGLEDILNGTEEAPGLIEEVGDIADALYGTEGENPVPGLIEEVETLGGEFDAVAKDLADNYYKKSETYTKTEVDGLVSGVFHFEGVKDSYDALPAEGNTKGDVYQVGDKEYAWNGTEWVELGFVVDLSGYYTKTEVDAEVKKVQDDLDIAEGAIEDLVDADIAINERIDGLEAAHETINGAIENLNTNVDNNATAITALQTADDEINEAINEAKEQHNLLVTEVGNLSTQYTTKFTEVDTNIASLQAKDVEHDTAIQGLTSYIGVPTDASLVIFPAIEGILNELEDLKIEAGAGETNVIEGVTVNGETIQPNSAKIVALPIFGGSKAGLVPAITETVKTNAVLSASGSWLDVEGLIDSKLEEALTWDSI